jgi:hypothetical protein
MCVANIIKYIEKTLDFISGLSQWCDLQYSLFTFDKHTKEGISPRSGEKFVHSLKRLSLIPSIRHEVHSNRPTATYTENKLQ